MSRVGRGSAFSGLRRELCLCFLLLRSTCRSREAHVVDIRFVLVSCKAQVFIYTYSVEGVCTFIRVSIEAAWAFDTRLGIAQNLEQRRVNCKINVNRPENTRGYQEMCGVGFRVWESEHEVSFGLAPRNGELSPSDHETPEPFNSPFRDRNPERTSDSNSPQNFGSVDQNLGSRGI